MLSLVRDIAEYAGDAADYTLVQLMRLENVIVAGMLIFVPAFVWFATGEWTSALVIGLAIFIPSCFVLSYMFEKPAVIRTAVEVIVELALFWVPLFLALAYGAWLVTQWIA